MNQHSINTSGRSKIAFLAILVGATLALFAVSVNFANSAYGAVSQITTSTVSVDKSQASAGQTVEYTIVIKNSSPTTDASVVMTDVIPAGLTYVAGSYDETFEEGDAAGNGGESSGTISWAGAIVGNKEIEITFSATVDAGTTIGQMITNTVEFSDSSSAITKTATFEVVDGPPATISGSTKMVDKAEAAIGERVDFTVVISNSTGGFALGIEMTDTLPATLEYVPGSMDVELPVGQAVQDGSSDTNGVISWDGGINGGQAVTVTYSAVVSTSATVSQTITNKAIFSQGGGTHEAEASFIVSDKPLVKIAYFPLIFAPVPSASNLEATRPEEDASVDNQYNWTLSWDVDAQNPNAVYVLEESNSEAFTTFTEYTTTATEREINQIPSISNVKYYRVKTRIGSQESEYTDIVRVVGPYRDDFSDESGGWKRVRQDFGDGDDVNNVDTIENGYYKMHVRGQFDYFLTSSLAEAPAPPYRITTRVKFDGPGNLNTYGINWGGDWNGGTCPELDYPYEGPFFDDRAEDNCFNHHYQARVLWFGSQDRLKVFIKRVDKYVGDTGNAVGSGGLWGFNDVTVGDDPGGWQTWTVEVYEDGTMRLLHGTRVIATVQDTTYDDPYFGLYAESNEYPGSDPLFDYIEVVPLD